jgi:hypothetical protein
MSDGGGSEAARIIAITLPDGDDEEEWVEAARACIDGWRDVGAVQMVVRPTSDLGKALIRHGEGRRAFLGAGRPVGAEEAVGNFRRAFFPDGAPDGGRFKFKKLYGAAHSLRLAIDKEDPSAAVSDEAVLSQSPLPLPTSTPDVHARMELALRRLWAATVEELGATEDWEQCRARLSSNIQVFAYFPAGTGIGDVISREDDGMLDVRISSEGTPPPDFAWSPAGPTSCQESYEAAVEKWVSEVRKLRACPIDTVTDGPTADGIGVSAHIDSNLLSAVISDKEPESGGLQVLVPPTEGASSWQVLSEPSPSMSPELSASDAAASGSVALPPSFLLFPGAAAQRILLGRIPATLHRVVLPKQGGPIRVSSVVKLAADFEAASDDGMSPAVCSKLPIRPEPMETDLECCYAANLRASESAPSAPGRPSFIEMNPCVYAYSRSPRQPLSRLAGSWYHERRIMRAFTLEEVVQQRVFAVAQLKLFIRATPASPTASGSPVARAHADSSGWVRRVESVAAGEFNQRSATDPTV